MYIRRSLPAPCLDGNAAGWRVKYRCDIALDDYPVDHRLTIYQRSAYVITYLYWFAVLVLVGGILFGVGIKAQQWKTAIALSIVLLVVGWSTYYFNLQQVFVKRYGGVMTINVPEGQLHLTATWKDDNLWVENYDPKTNTCIFSEYSKGNMLQGRVTIKNCNPFGQR